MGSSCAMAAAVALQPDIQHPHLCLHHDACTPRGSWPGRGVAPGCDSPGRARQRQGRSVQKRGHCGFDRECVACRGSVRQKLQSVVCAALSGKMISKSAASSLRHVPQISGRLQKRRCRLSLCAFACRDFDSRSTRHSWTSCTTFAQPRGGMPANGAS